MRVPLGGGRIVTYSCERDLAAGEGAATRKLFRIAITPQDAIVFPQREQVLPGVVPEVFDGLGHLQLCSSARVMDWVAEQLANARA